MRTTGPIDKAERDDWNADANRRVKRWLIWTLLLLLVAYFIPLRWAVLLALFYARLADPELSLGHLPFAFPLPFLFRPPKRNTIYATSVVLKDESSGDTRARLHILENGDPALSLYGEKGDETVVFTSETRIREAQNLDEFGTNKVENPELEELRNEVSRLTESIEGHAEVQGALSHDSRVLLEAVRRIDPSAIRTMEEIRSYDDAAEERHHAHTKGERHWSDYEPSVKRLESEILKIKAAQLDTQARVAQLEREK